MNLEDHIISDPQILFGKPVLKGTRIPVDLILEKLAVGESAEQLLKAYPRVTTQSIKACLLTAKKALRVFTVFD